MGHRERARENCERKAGEDGGGWRSSKVLADWLHVRERTINSIVLLCNGISFAIQVVIFLVLGSFADFGSWRPNILIVLSLLAWGIGEFFFFFLFFFPYHVSQVTLFLISMCVAKDSAGSGCTTQRNGTAQWAYTSSG